MFENFEPKIENKIERETQDKPELELASVESVRGLNILSVMRRIANSSWGKESDIDKEINNLTKTEKDEVGEKFNSFMERSNEEALEWIAFAKGKPEEVKEKTIEQLMRHKGFKRNAAEKFFKEFTVLLDDTEGRYPKLVDSLDEKTEADRMTKEKNLEQIKGYLDKAAEFFNPKKETTKMRRVHLLPNDPLVPYPQGFSINMGEDVYIRATNASRGDINYTNIVHESLHPVINPITEKIKLNKQEKEKIKKMVSYQLRTDPGYKDNAQVLLNESLIRAYGMEFRGENPTLQNFRKQIETMTEEEYKEITKKAKRRGMAFESKTLEKFKAVESEEFYNKYIKDELGDRITDFYKDYAAQKEKQPDSSFEDYFIKNYKELLK